MNPLLHSAFSPIISSTVAKESCFKLPFKQNKLKNTYTDSLYTDSHLLPQMVLGAWLYLLTKKTVLDIFANV